MIAILLASLLLALAPASARTDDVQLAAQHLRDDHPNLFHDLSPAQFDAAVANLSAHADSLDDDQLLVGLMRLGAMPGVRDGHTGIFPLNPANRRLLHAYPIRMYTFADGTYVVGQAGGSDLLRARVVAVGGHPIEDVIAAVSPLVPHDNDSTLMLRVTTYLNTPEVLHGLGLVPDLGPVTFTFERGGNRFAASLTPLTVPEYGRGIGDLEHPLLPQGITAAVPAYVARRNQQIWTTTLAGKRVFYIGYNETLVSTAAVARRLSKAAKSKRLRAVIVDLRNNGGGDNHTYAYLLDALRRASKTERIVVLISRMTFSAAENFAADLERVAHPIFVGEPSGGSPNLYGDTANTLLPASGVELRVARDLLAEVDCRRSARRDRSAGAGLTVVGGILRGARSGARCRRRCRARRAEGAGRGSTTVLLRPGQAARPSARRGADQRRDRPAAADVRRGPWTEEGVLDTSRGARAVARCSVFSRIGRRCDEPASGCGPACAPRHRVLDRRPAAGARQLSCAG